AVIQTNPPDRETTTNLADRMIEAARKPITVAGLPVSVGASIGIAIAPAHGTRSDQIMRSADLALYRAKQSGRNTFRIYEVEMDRVAQERRVLERQVSRALEQDQFELHFQPLVEVDSDRVTGFEALVRWNHPDRGSVSPEIFIPVAEQTGAIRAIGEWVLKQACNTAAHWPDDLTLAVNLSVRQFENGRIIRSVTEALEASSLPAGKLEIEVTESVLIEHPEETIEILKELKALGVSIAIDDFGTGYSSLSYLWKFPFDKIKLDQSFVAAIEHDKVACDILRIIGSLGQTLGMRITAEGVETIEQADFLRTIACHQLQGFYFSKPLAPDELPAFLAENLTGRIRQESGPPKKSGRKAAGEK
ncbi:MAG TPA: GGDEF domain-containing phosphodiesterase, partial [Afifellaceae bacterium]|nr:GGDEF domain-containing phosphodiesterase [Afifellaceae bacterium]